MKITLTHSETEFFQAVAWRIVAEMLNNPRAVIGLSTGRTTGGVHAALRDIFHAAPFDVSGVTVFNIDEVTNVPRDYFGSCYAMILEEVVRPLGIPMENFLMPLTYADDFDAEARLFARRIAERGGVDLLVLGIGENGHLGFNQPGTPFERVAWHSRMDDALETRIRRETSAPGDLTLGGITLGPKDIMHSWRIVLAANGSRKAGIISAALTGPVTPDVPASVLQLHPGCEAILDPAAGELLR
jgi:glucosamine-6-phosphate deaminase